MLTPLGFSELYINVSILKLIKFLNNGAETMDNINVNIRFIPDYLEEYINQGIELSAYDTIDLYTMSRLMINQLTNVNADNRNRDLRVVNKLLDMYYNEGDISFTDDTVLIDGYEAYKLNISITDDTASVDIICKKGSSNILVSNNILLARRIAEWLIDGMFNRLNEESVISTDLFYGYWCRPINNNRGSLRC